MSQVDDVKAEPDSQDATMEDAPSPAAPAEKAKVSLEDMFDDDEDDSDGEFASSAPVKSEEESSQLAPVFVHDPPSKTRPLTQAQQDLQSVALFRS